MKLLKILIGTEQCWTISLDLTIFHDKGELYIPTNVHKSIMMSQNGGGAGKSVSTTTNYNSPCPRCATDHPMKQGKGKQSNGVIVKSNNGEFSLLPDCNTCHYMNQNIQCFFSFITLDGRKRRSCSKNSKGHND